MRAYAMAVALTGAFAGEALAEGCALDGGETAPRIEAMNQMILDLKFQDVSNALREEANVNIDDVVPSLADIYKAGFNGCRTIAQRREVGGMTQNLVFFRGKAGPLFAYWMYVDTGEEFQLLKFNLDSDLDLMEMLR